MEMDDQTESESQDVPPDIEKKSSGAQMATIAVHLQKNVN